ncbi:MAG: ATP-binding cassette domain-containing protein [Clostridium sp.]|nr:ATP-binding cassette domain-containing protein [Prevotella sp.]MCM1429304.1 ATP-binding cassette domain-containing protein [Clostridium sp.]MCM1475663.1 ATP-binding cassette domain-containing protein [Muribaculaceae bacterium]
MINPTEDSVKYDSMNALHIENLTKKFGHVQALDNVSFDIDRGSICGLLGPNGAGKTTLLRIINSILVADSGRVLVNGQSASRATTGLIGYMPEERGLYDKMRVEEQILYFGQLKGGSRVRLREVMNEYLEMFQLKGQEKRRVKELSKGNQQKVQIITTLVHEPDIVILDEPFSGFDPINGAILQQIIDKLHNQGTTVILSSHNMPAIEEMCSDIALINKGRLLVKDSIENIKEQHKDNSLLLTVVTPLNIADVMTSGIIEEMVSIPPRNWRKGFAYNVIKKQGTKNIDIINHVASQSEILHFEEALPSLTDIFFNYTK